MTHPTLRQLLQAARLDRSVPDLESLASESLRLKIHPAEERKLPLGVIKMGGLPDLPADQPWPDQNGAPLAFLVQLRLSDLHQYAAAQILPATGRLSFFYDARQQAFGDHPSDRGAWQVLYHPAENVDKLRRLAAPDSLPANARFPAFSVELFTELTLPQDPAFFQPGLGWTADEQDRYDDLLFRLHSDPSYPRHRLLGHPDVIQDDMHLQCQLAAHGADGIHDLRAAQLSPAARNWQLLLQLDSDANAAMQWGNSGRLYFWIESEALRAGNFANVWMVLQSE